MHSKVKFNNTFPFYKNKKYKRLRFHTALTRKTEIMTPSKTVKYRSRGSYERLKASFQNIYPYLFNVYIFKELALIIQMRLLWKHILYTKCIPKHDDLFWDIFNKKKEYIYSIKQTKLLICSHLPSFSTCIQL